MVTVAVTVTVSAAAATMSWLVNTHGGPRHWTCRMIAALRGSGSGGQAPRIAKGIAQRQPRGALQLLGCSDAVTVHSERRSGRSGDSHCRKAPPAAAAATRSAAAAAAAAADNRGAAATPAVAAVQ